MADIRAGTVVFDIRASTRRFTPAMQAARRQVDLLTARVAALQAQLASLGGAGALGALGGTTAITKATNEQAKASQRQVRAAQDTAKANTSVARATTAVTRATKESTRATGDATRAIARQTNEVQKRSRAVVKAAQDEARAARAAPLAPVGGPATTLAQRRLQSIRIGQRGIPRVFTDPTTQAGLSGRTVVSIPPPIETRTVASLPPPPPTTTELGQRRLAGIRLRERAVIDDTIPEPVPRGVTRPHPTLGVQRATPGVLATPGPTAATARLESERAFQRALRQQQILIRLGADERERINRAADRRQEARRRLANIRRIREERLIQEGIDQAAERADERARRRARLSYSHILRGDVAGPYTALPAGYRGGIGGPAAQTRAVQEALGRQGGGARAGGRSGGRFAFGGPLARSVAGFGVPPGAVGGASLLAGGFIGVTAITAATGALIAYGAAWRQVQEVAGGARTSLSGLVDLVSGISTALRDSIGPLANYVASNVTLTDALTRFQDTAGGLGTDSSLRTFVDRGATRLGNAINAINDNPEALSTGIQLAGRATNAAVGGFTANIIARPIAVGVGLVARALAILPGPLGLLGRGLALVAEIMPSFATGFGVLAGLFPNFRRRLFEFIGAFTTGATFDAIKGFVSGIGDLANSIGGFFASIGITPENIALAFNGILKVLQFTAGALGGALDALATGIRNLRDFFSSLPSRLTNFVNRVLRGSPEGSQVSELGLFGEAPADSSPRTGPALAQLDALEARLPIVESFASELDAGADSIYGMVSAQHEANQRLDEYRAIREAANQAEADAIAALRRRIDLEARASEQSIEGVSAEARRERPSFNFQQDDDIRAFLQRPPPRLVREDDREAQRRRQLTEDLQLSNNAIDAITGRLDLIPSTDLEARLPLEQQRSQLFARRDTTLESLGIFDEEAASKLADRRNKENERILQEDLRRREREAAETQKAFEDLWITPMENSFSSFFHDAITGVHSLDDAFDNLVKSILSTLVNNAIAQPAASALSELFRAGVTSLRGGPETGQSELDIGARHLGGPVTAGRRYLVGEAGPELFQPSQSGEIVSNAELRSGGGQTVINNWYSNDTTAARATVEEMTPRILGLARKQSLDDMYRLRTT